MTRSPGVATAASYSAEPHDHRWEVGDSSVDRRKLNATDDLGPFTVDLDRSAIREVGEIVEGPVGPRHRRRGSRQPSADRGFRASFADAENSSRREEALIQAGLVLASELSLPAVRSSCIGRPRER
jgi:hypothetical protein